MGVGKGSHVFYFEDFEQEIHTRTRTSHDRHRVGFKARLAMPGVRRTALKARQRHTPRSHVS